MTTCVNKNRQGKFLKLGSNPIKKELRFKVNKFSNLSLTKTLAFLYIVDYNKKPHAFFVNHIEGFLIKIVINNEPCFSHRSHNSFFNWSSAGTTNWDSLLVVARQTVQFAPQFPCFCSQLLSVEQVFLTKF